MLFLRQLRGLLALAFAIALVLAGGALTAQAAPDPPLAAVKPPTGKVIPAKAKPAAVKERPAPAEKKRAVKKRKRRGPNPCMTPDPGWGIYDRWSRNISMGQMTAPQLGGLTRRGGFDLIVHFHGHYPIRKEFVKQARGAVLVAIDLGISSGPYNSAFASPHVFKRLLASVEQEMARRSGRSKTYVRKLALSAWSAGYGAIAQILRQPAGKKVDALILLDSVHTGYADASAKKLSTVGLEPFVKFARQAARGRRFMFQSVSSIIPPGYASTREVAHYMVKKLGGKMRRARRSDVLGLELFERYDSRGYHVRGYRGNDKPDHCAHLGLMKDVLRVHLKRRWHSPRGRKGKRDINKARQRARRNGTLYVVKSGDHLTGIAKKHNTSVRAIRDANGLERGGRPIQPGQELVIPKPSGEAATAKSVAGKPAGHKSKRHKKRAPKLRAGEKIHVVGDGHSLGRIARRYHTTVDAIRDRNDLRKGGKKIQPGQRLVIPAKTKKNR